MKLPAIAFVLSIVFTSTITAQDSSLNQSAGNQTSRRTWSLGIYAGPALPYFTDFPNIDPCCYGSMKFSAGETIGFYGGLCLNMSVGNGGSSIVAAVGYSQLSGRFQGDGREMESSDGKGNTINILLRQHGSVSLTLLTAEVLYSQRVIQGLFINIGPTLGYYLSGGYEQTETIESPSGLHYAPSADLQLRDDNRTKVLDEEKSPKFSPRIGLKFGLQYDLSIAANISLLPGVWADFALTDITKDMAWRVHSMQIGLETRFSL